MTDDDRPVLDTQPVRRPSSTEPRWDTDDEWDANGWERVPTWEERPRG
jgi:hypothetical protein